MKVLVAGASGFVGKNLVAALENLRGRKDGTRPNLCITDIFEYDISTPPEALRDYCTQADFVFDFAGVNRPKDNSEFMLGNCDFTRQLVSLLEDCGNLCPIMYASSVQACCVGKYADSAYGKSKKAGEDVVYDYGSRNGVKTYIYRFPNVFGKWCKPNYNSAVATFCYNTARDLPVLVTDENITLQLLYIDDLTAAMLTCLEGGAARCNYDGDVLMPAEDGKYAYVPTTHTATLGEIVRLLKEFKGYSESVVMPSQPQGSFEKKLFATYLSYLPKEKTAFSPKTNADARGSFTELLKTKNCGQFSVNVTKPGVTKGQHWHHTKWELFITVAGRGRIRERNLATGEVMEFDVSADKLQIVYMLPGYTHSITNLSETEDLVTLMWANEQFDKAHPDTFSEEV